MTPGFELYYCELHCLCATLVCDDVVATSQIYGFELIALDSIDRRKRKANRFLDMDLVRVIHSGLNDYSFLQVLKKLLHIFGEQDRII